MKKSMFASVKPLAMATAIAAGTSVSMIAVALPGGGDTLGAAKVVNESVCFNTVDMTIASGSRSVTTGTGDCQLRTLVPTKGFQGFDTTPAGATVNDSSALVNAGGESYETYVGGKRKGSMLLTPNRSLAVTRSSSFVTGTNGSVSFDLGAAVQPATGLQSSWMTGTYNIVDRSHAFAQVASGLEHSVYANPNTSLGEINSTAAMQVTFNGDGTCSIDAMDNHRSFQLTKDPLDALGLLEMDNGCTVGGGSCAQSDFSNYIARGVVNLGSNGTQTNYYDWNDQNLDGNGGQATGCTYTTGSGVVTVAYQTEEFSGGDPTALDWTVAYNVSADLRYLVAAQTGTLAQTGGAAGPDKGDLSIGVRVGAGDVTGNTYLFNQTTATYAASTPTTPSYENPQSPTYQEEECITRGSIEFTGTSVGGGFNACNVQSVSSCAGRHIAGYEESSAGAADGTVVDSLTAADGVDTDVTACRWSNSGGLVVQMDTVDPALNPITVNYTGDVSDNGEALVMQGAYAAQGPAPDVDNPPALAQMQYNMLNYMVGMEYQGSLTGDADSDTTTNYNEFVWAADVTPASGTIKRDYNGDGGSDLLFSRTSDGQLQTWIVDSTTGTTTSGKSWVTLQGAPWAVVGTGDFDKNGRNDILYQNTTTGQLMVMQLGSNGMTYTTKYWLGNALAPATNWVLQGVADFNGDGNADVMFRRSTDGQVQVWLTSTDGLTVASKVWVAPRSTNWIIKGFGDLNGDGRSDVVWRDNTTGQMAAWIMGTSGTTIDTNAWLPEAVTDASTWFYQGLGDVDGDGGDDLLFRRSTDGQIMVWLMASNGVTRTSKNWIAPIATTWTIKDTGVDYNADGRDDILFSNTSGQHQVWLMAAGGVTTSAKSWLSNAITGWDYKPAN